MEDTPNALGRARSTRLAYHQGTNVADSCRRTSVMPCTGMPPSKAASRRAQPNDSLANLLASLQMAKAVVMGGAVPASHGSVGFFATHSHNVHLGRNGSGLVRRSINLSGAMINHYHSARRFQIRDPTSGLFVRSIQLTRRCLPVLLVRSATRLAERRRRRCFSSVHGLCLFLLCTAASANPGATLTRGRGKHWGKVGRFRS